ncbi:MAG: tetratricopeptide repeat protein, partial [Pyrinomonadaceae bacterium]
NLPLDVIASNQLMTVAPGDTLWIVTLTQERELVLAGRLAVGEVVEYEEAIRRMPDAGLWQAEYYAFPEPGTEEYIREIDIHDLAEDLRFDSENDRLVLRDGKINPQQFQSMRKLTRQSVEMLEEAFYTIGPFAADELEPETMLDLARQMVEMMPDDADAQYNFGVALGRNDMYEDEVRAYEKVLELDPAYFGAHYNLGNVLIRLGRYEEAIEALNKAILISGEFAPAHFMLGAGYGEVGRYEEAILATQAGLDIEPDDPSAHFNIGRFYYLQGDFLSACGYFDNAIAIAPDSFRAF